MKIRLLLCAVLGGILVALFVLILWGDVESSVATSNSVASESASYVPNRGATDSEVRVDVVEDFPERDGKALGVKGPKESDFIIYEDLAPLVKSFVKHANDSSFGLSNLELFEFHPRDVDGFTAMVKKFSEELDGAKEIYKKEIKLAMERAIHNGEVRNFPDDASLLAAQKELENDQSILLCSQIGEDEGPSGEAQAYFGLVALSLVSNAALKEAKAYVDSFEQWRIQLRAYAVGLLANARERVRLK